MTSTSLCRMLAGLLLLLGPGSLAAQDTPRLADPRPQSAQTTHFTSVRSGTVSSPLFTRSISIDVSRVSVEQALRTITNLAGIDLTYSQDLLPERGTVSLRSSSIRVVDALDRVLEGTDLDVVVSAAGKAALVRRPRGTAVRTGSIGGTVTDAETGAPVAAAEVWIEGSRWRTLTSNQGRFLLTGVAAGSHEVSARRIGYAVQRRTVEVVAGQAATLNIPLTAAPTYLDGVVATVTGDQRVREMGHVVGRINADSVVRSAPVMNVTELLTARVPGMQVFTSQGTVGGDAAIRIRGSVSAALAQEPIVIVDGVRYASGRRSASGTTASSLYAEPTARLNDINPNSIESIEVVKGPSASTLYGTDAVNGVIVITTKRGAAGPPQWSAYSRFGVAEISSNRFNDDYVGISAQMPNCTLAQVAQAACVQEGIRIVENPLNNPALTIFSSAPRREFGANVSGGAGGVRYFLAADLEDATGPVRMPLELIGYLQEQRGVDRLPDEHLRPNTMQKLNLRSNLGVELSSRSTAQINVGYTGSDVRSMRTTPNPYTQGASDRTPDNPYGSNYTPDRIFSMTSAEAVTRMTGSLRLETRPSDWLSLWGSAGMDYTGSTRQGLTLPGQGMGLAQGGADDTRGRAILTTVDLGGTVSSAISSNFSSRTSVGSQFVRNFYDGTATTGNGLPPGGRTVGSAATRSVNSSYSEVVTLGAYLEQMVGINERLFLTGAVRADGASTFGREYNAAVYPKGSVSWIISEEPFIPRISWIDETRLRYAYGASGRQPNTGMALPSYFRSQVFIDGVSQVALNLSSLGSLDLRPERTREHEFGIDVSAFNSRANLELTRYSRVATDGLQTMDLQPGYAFIWVNFGRIEDSGFEGRVWLRPVDSRRLSWDVSLAHSTNNNTLVDLGDAVTRYHLRGGVVEGYPIGARFMTPLLGYEDRNGDGIIDRSEVIMGDSAVYVGRSDPGILQSLTSTFGFARDRIRVTSLFERRAGYTQLDVQGQLRCQRGYCPAAVDPSTPLSEQARVAAIGLSGRNGVGYSFIEDADFIRFRELSLAFDLPQRMSDALRLGQATVNLQGRNLALWTPFSGVDVESVVGAGSQWATGINGAGGSPDGIPQARSWAVRLDVAF